ncbi:hypothetical protein F5876DRAFT_62308 [Lentinula aff. lateritia]|uniref:Uncharacterized protein n=1 Tax=Lentinula aff. lateritia TaxID=2804960 RepID=A0ACC1UC19_9AGAR|nr:hypothetical protein F5876DRAFT_62308 [Lentinula aff. lateritia]
MSNFSKYDTTSLFVPFEGMYIAFSFDVQKTLELHRCDPEDYTHISEEVDNFPLHKYVGILVDHVNLPLPDRKYQTVSIRPLQKGLNIPIPQFDIQEDMLPTEDRDYSRAYEMTDRSLWQMRKYLGEDARRRKLPPKPKILAEMSSTSKQGSGSLLDMKRYSLAQRRPDELNELTVKLEGSKASPSRRLMIEGIDGDRPLEIEVHHPAFAPMIDTMWPDNVNGDPVFTPVVKFDSDISAMHNFPNACELYEHLDALEILVKKCQQGPPLAPEIQSNITSAAAEFNINEVIEKPNHWSKETTFSTRLRRLVFFHSKKTVHRQPTNELKVVVSNPNVLNGEEDASIPSKPKNLKSLMNVIAFFQRKIGHAGTQAIGSQPLTSVHSKTLPNDDESPGARANASTNEDHSSTPIGKNMSQFGKRSSTTKQSQQHAIKTPEIGGVFSQINEKCSQECIGPSAGFHEDEPLRH